MKPFRWTMIDISKLGMILLGASFDMVKVEVRTEQVQEELENNHDYTALYWAYPIANNSSWI